MAQSNPAPPHPFTCLSSYLTLSLPTQLTHSLLNLLSRYSTHLSCHSWHLTPLHPYLSQVLQNVDKLSMAVRAVLGSQRALWGVLHDWDMAMDTMYSKVGA